MPDRDLRFFDQVSSRYDTHWIQRFARPIHARLLGTIQRPPEAVLDVGCGTGALLGQIGERFPQARLAGIDAAPGMAAVARRRLPAAEIRDGVAESLPWPDGAFDLAVTTLSFHHWRDQAQGIREVARVLGPGGTFLLADISGDGAIGVIVEGLRALSRHRDESFPPSPRVAAHMASAGFGQVSVAHLAPFRLISGRR
jgi:ubiquinone/menaquinone biosynthesis C-methylase UbiE